MSRTTQRCRETLAASSALTHATTAAAAASCHLQGSVSEQLAALLARGPMLAGEDSA
jgi:hypothetical protein